MLEGEHAGRTREGSALDFVATSVLDQALGVCDLWGLRAVVDGYPLERLAMASGQTLTTCEALGFVADDTLDSCPFGSSYTSCGFSLSAYYRYGNNCSGCQLNNGQHPAWMAERGSSARRDRSHLGTACSMHCRSACCRGSPPASVARCRAYDRVSPRWSCIATSCARCLPRSW